MKNGRIQRQRLSIVFYFLMVFFAVLVMLSALYDSAAMPKIRRGFYTENNISAYAPFEYDEAALLAFCEAQSELPFVFGRTYLSASMDLRHLYFSPEMETPPVIKGRFFTAEEMLSQEQLAVIGTDFVADVYTEAGVEYIDINRTAYQVIGVLGIGEASRLDDIIYLPLGALNEGVGQTGLYILDSTSLEAMIYLAPYLSELLAIPDTGMPFQTSYLSADSVITAALAQMSNITRISLVLLASISLAALFFTARWVAGCAPLIRTGRTLGFHPVQIYWLVYLPYASCAFCGVCLASGIYCLLEHFDVLLRLPLLWVLAALGVVALCVALQIAILIFAALHRLERRS